MILRLVSFFGLFCQITPILAYNANHGPFPQGSDIDLIPLIDIKGNPDHPHSSHTQYVFNLDEDSELIATRESDTWNVKLIHEGEILLPLTPFSSNGTLTGITAYRGDLNLDDHPDYVLYSFSGGNGLAIGYCDVGFILSSEDGYTLTTIVTLFPDDTDFIMLNGKPFFIHTSFHYVDECNDGKPHNFWIYNLLAIHGGEIRVNSSAYDAFPKTIWYTLKPNSHETGIITEEQKAGLLEGSLTGISSALGKKR